MAQPRMPLWAAEDIEEELQDVDVNLALGNYGQAEIYDEGVPRTIVLKYSEICTTGHSRTSETGKHAACYAEKDGKRGGVCPDP